MPGVWTVGFNIGLWTNQHLMKDCGVVPYMFHRVYGFEPAMLGCEEGEYPYLKYMPEMRLVPLPQDRDAYFRESLGFLRAHAGEMDLLVLIGPYPFYQVFLSEYRKLRPDGKVYMALDGNIYWNDRMDWTDPGFCEMLDSCDVIATSSRHLQRHLNRKWNRWVINYIPNGFFNPTGAVINPSFEEKENILLTVGRIGAGEKAHELLLEAFAWIHGDIPGWRVHLVGGVVESFKPYIEEYFSRYPELREKVIFKGLVEDKARLYAEYARAKVFVLTSNLEGGAPNVIGEALAHGCYTVTSALDASEEITNAGRCGRVFPVRNADALASILRDICPNDALFENAFPLTLAHARNNFDWEVLIKRCHHMLYGE